MSSPSHTRPRSWAGTSLAERQATRRRTLLAAGLELLGTHGAPAVTVRSVCRTAQLTDRYFYENFPDRAALLAAVYDQVALEAGQVLVDAVAGADSADEVAVVSAAVTGFLDLLTDDPRRGRVLLLEPYTDPVLGARASASTPRFAEIIIAELRARDGHAVDALLTATALVGALAALLARWLDGTLAVSRTVITDYCVRLVLGARTLARPS